LALPSSIRISATSFWMVIETGMAVFLFAIVEMIKGQIDVNVNLKRLVDAAFHQIIGAVNAAT
jgi:hypothetical protein